MVNKPRAKGTAAESMLVDYLKNHGWPWAERRALAGALDMGDVSGCPGLVWEVKATSRDFHMGAWVDEALLERANAKASHGILVIKPPYHGKGKIHQWLAVMAAWDFDALVERCPVPIRISDIGPYSQSKLVHDVRDFCQSSDAMVPVLQRRSPGTKDSPQDWYRITHLEHMVNLLRSTGYGTPFEE